MQTRSSLCPPEEGLPGTGIAYRACERQFYSLYLHTQVTAEIVVYPCTRTLTLVPAGQERGRAGGKAEPGLQPRAPDHKLGLLPYQEHLLTARSLGSGLQEGAEEVG